MKYPDPMKVFIMISKRFSTGVIHNHDKIFAPRNNTYLATIQSFRARNPVTDKSPYRGQTLHEI